MEQINDSNIKKFIELNYNKLIILFFIKFNDFSKITSILKSFCNANPVYTYYTIDLNKFEGSSEYIDNIKRTPQFDIYFFNNRLCTSFETEATEINKILANIYNGISESYIEQMINVDTVKKQILDLAKAQDIPYYEKLLQNPNLLQSITNSNIFKSHQNQSKILKKNDQNLYNSVDLTSHQLNNNLQPTAINILNSQSSLLNNELVPTLQQMQYMFKIFKMMQQMGILEIPVKNNTILDSEVDDQNPILLKNGDKLIKLNDGRYGLIKNNC